MKKSDKNRVYAGLCYIVFIFFVFLSFFSPADLRTLCGVAAVMFLCLGLNFRIEALEIDTGFDSSKWFKNDK
jgi:hypothetical protein